LFPSTKGKAAKSKALRKTTFAEIFVFASFGNVRFSKIRVVTSCSSFFRTRPNSRKLVPTLIFAKKIAKKQSERVGNCRFSKIRVGTSFSSFSRTGSEMSRLVPTRKPTRNFEFKFGMQDPSKKTEKSSRCKYTLSLSVSTVVFHQCEGKIFKYSTNLA